MTAVLVMSQGEVEEQRELWRKTRHGMLTASDFAAMLGLAPKHWKHATPFALYEMKSAPEPPEDDDDEQLALGRYMEEWVARGFARQFPELVVGEGGLYRDSERPWLGATFDRLAWDHVPSFDEELIPSHAVVQCKTAAWRDPQEWGQPRTAVIPKYYRPQVLIELYLSGAKVAYVPVMFHDTRKVLVWVIERDRDVEDDIAWLLEQADKFKARLDEGRPPPVDGWPATTQAVISRFGFEINDERVTIPWKIARKYRRAVLAADAMNEQRAELENEIRLRLGTAKRAVDPAGNKLVTRSVSAPPERIDVGALREQRPDIAKEFTKIGDPIDKLLPLRKSWAKDQ